MGWIQAPWRGISARHDRPRARPICCRRGPYSNDRRFLVDNQARRGGDVPQSQRQNTFRSTSPNFSSDIITAPTSISSERRSGDVKIEPPLKGLRPNRRRSSNNSFVLFLIVRPDSRKYMRKGRIYRPERMRRLSYRTVHSLVCL